jgi:hypothetical protein
VEKINILLVEDFFYGELFRFKEVRNTPYGSQTVEGDRHCTRRSVLEHLCDLQQCLAKVLLL